MVKKERKNVREFSSGNFKLISMREKDAEYSESMLPVMTCNDAVRTALAESGITQAKLAAELGYEGQSTVSFAINSRRMSFEKFSEMMNGLGYTIFIGIKDGEEVDLKCIVE